MTKSTHSASCRPASLTSNCELHLGGEAAAVGDGQELGVGLTGLPVALRDDRGRLVDVDGLAESELVAAVDAGDGEARPRSVRRSNGRRDPERARLDPVALVLHAVGEPREREPERRARRRPRRARRSRPASCCLSSASLRFLSLGQAPGSGAAFVPIANHPIRRFPFKPFGCCGASYPSGGAPRRPARGQARAAFSEPISATRAPRCTTSHRHAPRSRPCSPPPRSWRRQAQRCSLRG